MTNALDALLARVSDPALRSAIGAEVERLRQTKDFGLVFDRHIPESIRLYSHPVKRGARVQERTAGSDTSWLVRRVRNGKALLVDADGAEETRAAAELVVIREFGEPMYPGLKRVGHLSRGGDKPSHILINGENFHALEMLLYCTEGMVDLNYIDPPYNTGAKDWKYNNDYVDQNDLYRHSKWLSFIEKRLRLAKRLLRPDNSVFLITIDDTEVYSLGLLLDEVFKGCERQVVSITISPRGKSRDGRLSQVDEYLIVVYIGEAVASNFMGSGVNSEVRWRYLRRNDIESKRGTAKGGPSQFYPIYVDKKTQRIVKLGAALTPDESLDSVPPVRGAVPVFPINEADVHMNWGLTAPSLQRALDDGYVRVTPGVHDAQPFTFAYLTGPNIKKVEAGIYEVAGKRPDGSNIVVIPGGKATRPTTAWRDTLYDAGAHGTSLLRSLIPDRTFPYPKSLYAVEDCLRLFIQDKPDAVVLDFFAGSGTTAHALARLNGLDGGRRRSILITNNEVSEEEGRALRTDGHQPGDAAWESQGIFQHVAMPRLCAAVTGETPSGDPVEGEYRRTPESPLSAGLAENVEFFEFVYLARNDVSRGTAFAEIAPLLWIKAGSTGQMIREEEAPFSAPPDGRYAILFEINQWQRFADAIRGRDDLVHVFVVTDSVAQYQQVVGELPLTVESSMLYDDYLRSFELNRGGEP